MSSGFTVETSIIQTVGEEYKEQGAVLRAQIEEIEKLKQELLIAGTSYEHMMDTFEKLVEGINRLHAAIAAMSDCLLDITQDYEGSEKESSDIAALIATIEQLIAMLTGEDKPGKGGSGSSGSDPATGGGSGGSGRGNGGNSGNGDNGGTKKKDKDKSDPDPSPSSPSNPGTGGDADGFSDKGFDLLCSLEVGSNAKRDANGKITAIKTVDIGDGGYTVGVGVYIKKGDTKKIQEFKDKYGIDVTDTSQYVPYDLCKKIFNDQKAYPISTVDNALKKYNVEVTQSQYDALVIMAYNRPKLFQDGHAVAKLLESGNMNQSDWRNALINEYKGLNQWDKYGKGWTNRIDDEVECFFDGDYKRNH